MTFGQKLKELRTGRGMTQVGLAQASGIPLGTIRDYEQGSRDPLLSNAQRLAAALAVSLDVFPAPPLTIPPAAAERKAPTKKGPARKKGN
jgi:transcriptional regulator with XRE-family HTH domain